MNKKDIVVPKGVRYISEWEDYGLHMTPGPCIIDKKIPGCGFTEFYLTCNEPVIIASPRVMLIMNKYEQHGDKIYAAYNPDIDSDPRGDIDITSTMNRTENFTRIRQSQKLVMSSYQNQKNKKNSKFSVFRRAMSDLSLYLSRTVQEGLVPKILVTYDSFPLIAAILNKFGCLSKFTVMVDEFQSILQDSKFKSQAEIKFVRSLFDLRIINKVHFVSATPMLDKYINLLPGFSNLDYYSLDWYRDQPERLTIPNLSVKSMRTVGEAMYPIIKKYLKGNFPKKITVDEVSGLPFTQYSTEAVFYVNSVKHILHAIKKYNLTPDQVNILCSRTKENKVQLERTLGSQYTIGTVPLKGEDHKMFTFCTRTAYLGADFYSKCASSYIFSDANFDCLALDISLDLPQILGRQRLSENPWKDQATLFYKITDDYRSIPRSVFDQTLQEKVSKTNDAIFALEHMKSSMSALNRDTSVVFSRINIALSQSGKVNRLDYLSMDPFEKDKPIFDYYSKAADEMAFDIQQVDYADRFSVFAKLSNTIMGGSSITHSIDVSDGVEEYQKYSGTRERLIFLYEVWVEKGQDYLIELLNQIPWKDAAVRYMMDLGPEVCKAASFNISRFLKKEHSTPKAPKPKKVKVKVPRVRKVISLQDKWDAFSDKDKLSELILSQFEVGKAYTRKQAKEMLADIYSSVGHVVTAKASDLSKYFEIKSGKVNDGTGTYLNSIEIVRRL